MYVTTAWMDQWLNATNELVKLLEQQKIRLGECHKHGLVKAPEALRDVLSGKNLANN